MRRNSNARTRRTAVAAVECAFLLPVLMVLVLGVWEIGRLIQIAQLANNAAREGARQASSAKYTIAQVRQATFEYLKNSGVPLHDTLDSSSVTLSTTNITITAVNEDGSETFDAAQFDRLRVTVTVPMKNFHWLSSNYFMPVGTAVNAAAGYLCVKDLPISVPSTIPQQPLT
ncbi:MAG: TadE/TadG family type IV pilus assembly protein [Gemmataceae bacterium]